MGVMLVRGLFRTLKLCLEAQIQHYVPIHHPVVSWLLEHTCFLLNIMTRGSDGHTPWARIKGGPFGLQIAGFGETVLYKHPTKGPQSQPDGNMGAVQSEGIFVGYSYNANTYTILTQDGKVDARSMTRRPEPNRWAPQRIADIRVTPW